MRISKSFFYTLREDVKNEETTSGKLLVKSGMIKKEGAGIYMFMPLGLKVIHKLENIIREEMNNAGATEVLMPSLIHQDIYEKSGRNKAFGSSVFKLNDRFAKPYILGPTHEELFTIAAMQKVRSYKDLPFNIYQFQNKFRDEPRPRYGLIRVREFIMKDAYSFDTDLDGLDISYNKMIKAYKNVCDRLNIDYRIVTADTGVMGGLLSEEFQAVTEIGEDILVMCDKCDYASNIEVAKVDLDRKDNEEEKPIELVHTPNLKTVEDVANTLNTTKDKLIKTMIFKAGEELIACLIPGDREANEVKIAKLLDVPELEKPDYENEDITFGFVGPKDLDIKIIIDNSLLNSKNMVIGANKVDHHYINANINRDFTYDISGDITNVKEGDICPKCGGTIHFKKGIEIANPFKLGTKYSEAMGLNYLDQNNELKPVVMGSYGIGIGRTIASIIEQNNDEAGIIWPEEIAPYKVVLVQINMQDEIQTNFANKVYETLKNKNIEVIFDDRDERPGVKFADAELIGIPYKIVVGRDAETEKLEFGKRLSKETETIALEEVLNKLRN